MRATSFREVRALLEGLGDAPALAGPWSYSEVLQHCAQSIECSMQGYPKLRSGLFRATIGRIAKRKFLKQGHMSHDLAAAIPGAPALDPALPLEAARERLLTAMGRFEALAAEPKEHLAYGPCTKAEYERLHAMHVANHLGA
ncbi:MAG: DUF1569 domain-containing protein [Polyangiaceae bacterium]|nr:DUF1569 domain-containing protein [Polyangiaceae bacterium]MCE7894971.1 DUF1569 domain-containing protein [Sorangiineae bacterium PRO1]MCL4753065.1 DUF1569 domain-containing protein [Myxococcales bacterium]